VTVGSGLVAPVKAVWTLDGTVDGTTVSCTFTPSVAVPLTLWYVAVMVTSPPWVPLGVKSPVPSMAPTGGESVVQAGEIGWDDPSL
jgi:hypothetical protein